jgi:flotillin
MEEIISVLATLLTVAGIFGFAFLYTVKNLVYICGPNEVLVFSGSTSVVGNRRVGYRIVKGGMSIRKPIIERVERIDLTNMTVEVGVNEAYSLGGIPLNIQGVAILKVAGHQPELHNALERFLGRTRNDILKAAKETLEGNLRGVLSQLTPEQVNNDKLAFAEKLLDEADTDLRKLGLVLDVLKIQNVTDDMGYLDSIGRKQSAEIIKRARVAEAQAKAVSTIQAAEQRKLARVAEAKAEIEIVRATTDKRITDAQTQRKAVIAEEVGRVRALIARAEADLKVQEARIEQVRLALEADVIAPAQAGMEKDQADARANAAKIIEDGKATALVLEEMITTWNNGGDSARDIFLMQKLQSVMSRLVDTIQSVKIDKITVLPSGSHRAANAVTLVEELKAGLGIDLPKIVNRLGGSVE